MEATPIGLTPGSPDILSAFQLVDYDATTDTLTVGGFALTLDGGAIAGGGFSLTATIDDTGALSPGGSLTITGTVPSLGFLSGTLLTGSITSFGFPDLGGDPFEFVFNVTGGDAAGIFGIQGGTILSGTGFSVPSGFTASFSNGGTAGISDTFGVPEPSVLLLLSVGLLAAVRRRT